MKMKDVFRNNYSELQEFDLEEVFSENAKRFIAESGYTAEQSAYLLLLAREYGLTPTGGSDFHGLNKPAISLGSGKGDLFVPYELLEGLKERKEKSSE